MGKKEKKYGPKSALEAEQIEALRVQLDDGIYPASDEAEVSALADHLAQIEDIQRLVALYHATPNRKLKKEVNKALYRLKQRGLAVPDLKEHPEAIEIAAGPVEVQDLPVLMARPDIDAQRSFLFAHADGRNLVGVEAQFHVPLGLVRLTPFRSSRTHFRKYTEGLASRKSPRMREPPSYLLVGEALRKRKLWEIANLARDKKLGQQVDRRLLDSLEQPDRPPLHPAWDLDLTGTSALSIDELGRLDFCLRPFYHAPAHARLKAQVEDWKAEGVIQGPGEEGNVDEKLFTAIGDWANQWGFDAIAELLLDSALFYFTAGLADIAATFREVVNAPRIDPRDRQIHAFLDQYIRWSFAPQNPS